ncbi:MAG TPA: hypothetical protein VMT00_08585 [Thermoanaerobaculia bacterium]|nr:hypothetical protein [Thermoanaerobaculia bacterium]
MTDNRRSNAERKGFWDGGQKGHGSSRESGGKKSGYPGRREPKIIGIRTDLDRPATNRQPAAPDSGSHPEA